MNKIYYSNILHYFKLSKVKMKTKSAKISKYFINNVSMHNNHPLVMVNFQHLGQTHSFLRENMEFFASFFN